MLISVYDKHGIMFEVNPELAKKLVINDGWEMTKPVAKPVTKPVVVDAPVVEHDAKTVEMAPAKEDAPQTGVAQPAPVVHPATPGPSPL